MQPLAQWYAKFKPNATELCLERKDYDLLARWPKAGAVEGFLYSPRGIHFEGLRLTYDTGSGRYSKLSKPEQAVIE